MPHLTRITVVFTGPAIAAWRRQQILDRTKAIVQADRDANPCFAWVMSEIDRLFFALAEERQIFKTPIQNALKLKAFRPHYRWQRVR